ncbi:MAG: 2-oxoglutarate and iron-dependent oxygenase domain-containing protein [Candidatus Binatia bacterium]|nr:2-oxoglutarate and iron-dependent oxygenase domain-containing protein [Candidatus Binatia bacterium]
MSGRLRSEHLTDHNARVVHVRTIDLGSGEGESTLPPLARDVVDEIASACREIGFFQIVGHGIAAERIDRLRHDMHRFFQQPVAVKREVLRTEVHPWGYYDKELTKNTPDWKEVYDFGRLPHPDRPEDDPSNAGLDGPNRWPTDLPGFRCAMLEYLQACERVALRLLGGMATGLDASPETLEAHFRPMHSSFVRLNHYPVCDDPASPETLDLPIEGRLGVNQHNDAGALTLVAQTDERGLQVRTDAGWLGVEPIPGALVVNIGDMMQVWSNDRYRSPLHRVVVSDRTERYSAPFFFNPSYDAVCAPLPDPGRAPRYRPVPWGEFRSLRAAGDYANVGEEVQVADYRISR